MLDLTIQGGWRQKFKERNVLSIGSNYWSGEGVGVLHFFSCTYTCIYIMLTTMNVMIYHGFKENITTFIDKNCTQFFGHRIIFKTWSMLIWPSSASTVLMFKNFQFVLTIQSKTVKLEEPCYHYGEYSVLRRFFLWGKLTRDMKVYIRSILRRKVKLRPIIPGKDLWWTRWFYIRDLIKTLNLGVFLTLYSLILNCVRI